MMIRLILVAFVAAFGLHAELTPEQEQHAHDVKAQLIAPCCWSETVAEHRSPISLEMRKEIDEMVAAGRTEREILDHYKAEYGMRIFVEPEGGLFWVMNVVPVVMVVLGLAAVVFFLRRMMRPVETDEPTEESA